MWKTKHQENCKDKTRYLVVETVHALQDVSGDTLEDFHLEPQMVRAYCASCGAVGDWKVRKCNYLSR